MDKKDLLKESIADAKKIKEVAIENAKSSIEEMITPHLKEKLSQKIQEMEDETEEVCESDDVENNDGMDKDGMYENDSIKEEEDEELDLDELLAEMEGEEEGEADLDEAKDEEVEEVNEEEKSETEDEEFNIEEMSESDLEGFIKETVQEMVDNGELDGETENVESEEEVSEVKVDKVKENKLKTLENKVKLYEKQIQDLTSTLNETNLLNSKLIYLNKLSKGKNLTESQVLEIINHFDKADTVKEAKIIYETLVKKMVKTKKKPINESLKISSASKAIKSVKKEIIDVDPAFARMQKLAGL